MKTIVCFAAAAVISFILCGCMSAREEQNPQPRTRVPYAEWTAAKGKIKTEVKETKTPPAKSLPKK